MNKRGQFYMVAAIVIAAIVIGFVSVSNYAKTDSSERIYNLRDELQIESSKVVDHGIYNGLSVPDMRQLQKDFVTNYTTYRITENTYFVIGNKGDITVMAYQRLGEDASVEIDGSQTELNIIEGVVFSQDFSPGNDTVNLIVDDSPHVFELNSGENFYFVIHGVTEGNVYFISNSQNSSS